MIGSMNLDPRSALLNTELALVIHSPPIADEAAQLFERGIRPEASYRVELASPDELARLKSTGSPLSPLDLDRPRNTTARSPTTSIRKRACTVTR